MYSFRGVDLFRRIHKRKRHSKNAQMGVTTQPAQLFLHDLGIFEGIGMLRREALKNLASIPSFQACRQLTLKGEKRGRVEYTISASDTPLHLKRSE